MTPPPSPTVTLPLPTPSALKAGISPLVPMALMAPNTNVSYKPPISPILARATLVPAILSTSALLTVASIKSKVPPTSSLARAAWQILPCPILPVAATIGQALRYPLATRSSWATIRVPYTQRIRAVASSVGPYAAWLVSVRIVLFWRMVACVSSAELQLRNFSWLIIYIVKS